MFSSSAWISKVQVADQVESTAAAAAAAAAVNREELWYWFKKNIFEYWQLSLLLIFNSVSPTKKCRPYG